MPSAKIHPPTPARLKLLSAALRRGELVAIPTETVYGLAANALDAAACRKIFSAKKRPAADPLIVHVLGVAQAEQLAEFNESARRLARRFWPGPLTLVLPKKAIVPDVVTAGGPTVAIRAPAHRLARKLLQLAGVPLAAPSANLFGHVSPTTTAHVLDGLGNRIAHVLEGGPCRVGVESTVLDLTDPRKPRILRPGAVTAGELAQFLGRKVRTTRRSGKLLRAPGMMESHYSPRTPLRLRQPPAKLPPSVAAIHLRRPPGPRNTAHFWLSRHGSLTEMARNLYRVLRDVDTRGFREIWVEPLPGDAGLAAALGDRLKRAAR